MLSDLIEAPWVADAVQKIDAAVAQHNAATEDKAERFAVAWGDRNAERDKANRNLPVEDRYQPGLLNVNNADFDLSIHGAHDFVPTRLCITLAMQRMFRWRQPDPETIFNVLHDCPANIKPFLTRRTGTDKIDVYAVQVWLYVDGITGGILQHALLDLLRAQESMYRQLIADCGFDHWNHVDKMTS